MSGYFLAVESRRNPAIPVTPDHITSEPGWELSLRTSRRQTQEIECALKLWKGFDSSSNIKISAPDSKAV
jgi:hypothetical protein